MTTLDGQDALFDLADLRPKPVRPGTSTDSPDPLYEINRRRRPMTSLADDVSLTEWLRFAVPLWMEEMARTGRRVLSEEIVNLGSRGDALQFAGSKRSSTILAAAGLVKGLASLALDNPDGVTWIGLHWCTRPGRHAGCPRAVPEPRPVVDVAGTLAELHRLETEFLALTETVKAP